ncbi:MAG: RNA pseudouridine synthase [Eubacteriales bacterium]|nr:RNA pseudouridine synthase [Eubacteriales bacterium]
MKKYKILHDDQSFLVVCKFAGLAVQSARASEPDLMSMLRNELAEREETNRYLGLVNRLDQPVEGLVLVARSEKAAADLSRQVADHDRMEKWYEALVCGKPAAPEGTLVDYLRKDGRTNTSGVVDKGTAGAKRSELRYEVIRTWEDVSLLRIRLLTGRHHQIRVQLAHAGFPIVGDAKYGGAKTRPSVMGAAAPGRAAAQPESRSSRLCLCACRLTFRHPLTGERMDFRTEPTFPVPPTARG